jgi:hypothetical protein
MRVRTGAHSQATLSLPNGSTVDLEENALLTLFTAPGASPNDPMATTTTLTRGTARVRASATGLRTAPIPLQTEAVTVWAGRADAMITADLGGHLTRMAVWRGRMRVRVGTREYLLTQGYGVQEESGHGPGVLRLLPRAPVWRSAPPPRVLTFGEPIDVQAMWSPNPRAAQANPASEWKVQVARDDAFRDVIASDVVPVSTTSYTGRRLAPGTYHLRVVAIDINRFESAASPVARVEVAAPTVIPAADAPEGRRAAVRVPDGFYCGLDGGALTATGLQQIHRPVLAFQLPAMFQSPEEFLRAYTTLRPEIEAGFARNNVALVHLSPALGPRMFSTREVRVPAAGTVTLRFDNSYSWLQSKTVRVERAAVGPGADAAAAN